MIREIVWQRTIHQASLCKFQKRSWEFFNSKRCRQLTCSSVCYAPGIKPQTMNICRPFDRLNPNVKNLTQFVLYFKLRRWWVIASSFLCSEHIRGSTWCFTYKCMCTFSLGCVSASSQSEVIVLMDCCSQGSEWMSSVPPRAISLSNWNSGGCHPVRQVTLKKDGDAGMIVERLYVNVISYNVL